MIVAGEVHTWQIEAQDIFENVVVGTDDLFGLQIADLGDPTTPVKEVGVEYNFSLYHATFSIEKASDYSAIVWLKQKGGLKATYYETTNF